MDTFRNLYLVAGLRGDFDCASSVEADLAEFAMLHTLDDRWGVPPPWGACDSGADLQSPGDEVLRGWCHVDLRTASDAQHPADAPLAGLLRSMWDALELFGKCRLTGVDAIVPLACVGEPMWLRVASSIIRNRSASGQPARVGVQASDAWPETDLLRLNSDAVITNLSEVVDVQAAMGDVQFASYPPSFRPNPFAYGIEHPWVASDTDPFRVEVALPSWTIDDAAWLAEAVSVSYARAGASGDLQIAVRLG